MARPYPHGSAATSSVAVLESVAGDLIATSLAPSSQLVYRRAAIKFANFCSSVLHREVYFPFTLHDLILFTAYLFSHNFAPATISTYIHAVSFLNSLSGQANLAKSFIIKKMLQGILRQGPPKLPRHPITLQLLHRLLQAIANDQMIMYDKFLFSAMFILAFHAFLRVGEFTANSPAHASKIVQFSDISSVLADGKPALQLSLRFFKGNTSRAPFSIVIPPSPNSPWCPVSVLQLFILARGPACGPLFCRANLLPVSRAEFSATLARFCSMLGFEA